MNLTVKPGQSLRGIVHVPGDKSISHRAALFAALAEGESRVENFLNSGVTQRMLAALTSLGVDWSLAGTSLRVQGRGWQNLAPPAAPLDCGNSATTLRLLAGALAAAGIPAVLDGSAGLRRRPMDRIVEPLRQMGVEINASPSGGAPLTLAARPGGAKLRPLAYHSPVASAQVKTCLLLASLAAAGPSTLSEPSCSRDHTERMLAAMGAEVLSRQDAGGAHVTPDSPHGTAETARSDHSRRLLRGRLLDHRRADYPPGADYAARGGVKPGSHWPSGGAGGNGSGHPHHQPP